MATLNFIRGTIRGKIGQFVGSSWKGKSYIKTFTKPGNPRTADQVAVRAVFQNVSHIAKSIYEAVLKPYTFPKPRKITAYNRMIQINKEMFESKEWDPAGLKIFEGPLENTGFNLSVSGDNVTMNFSPSGEATDKAIAVIYDGNTGTVLYNVSPRSAGSLAISIASVDSGARDSLHAYFAFAREPMPGTSEKGLNSGTAYKKIP
jgi:hypothetical protein